MSYSRNRAETSEQWDLILARLALGRDAESVELCRRLVTDSAARAHAVGRLNDEHLSEGAWRAAQWEVSQRVRDLGPGWIELTCQWLQEGHASWQRSASFCSDIAWVARSVGSSALLHLDLRELAEERPLEAQRGVRHLYLLSLRYDFRFSDMQEAISAIDAPLECLDPYTRALYACALLAQGLSSGLSEMKAVRQMGPKNAKIAHALLQGLHHGDYIFRRPQNIIELIETTPALQGSDAIAQLRKGYALRRLGRYDECLLSLDQGIMHLSPSAVDVHRDFVQERAIALAVREIGEAHRSESEKLRSESKGHVDRVGALVKLEMTRLQASVSDSLFRVVEILGLFTAIIALLASGAASVAIGNLSWWQRLAILAVVGVIVTGFFLMLRIVVRPKMSTGFKEADTADSGG